MKKYPVCYCAHRTIDCVLELVSSNRLTAEDVESVTVSLSDKYAAILRNHKPQTSLAAKFSIEFAVAAAIISRRVGLSEVTDEFVLRRDIQSLMDRVHVEPTTDYDPETPGAAMFDRVSINVRAGRVLQGRPVSMARGHSKSPLSESELYEKFSGCLEAGKYSEPSALLFERLCSLEKLSARQLVRGRAADGTAPQGLRSKRP
jgi:2-methylcitrate dehydratase PrpD